MNYKLTKLTNYAFYLFNVRHFKRQTASFNCQQTQLKKILVIGKSWRLILRYVLLKFSLFKLILREISINIIFRLFYFIDTIRYFLVRSFLRFFSMFWSRPILVNVSCVKLPSRCSTLKCKTIKNLKLFDRRSRFRKLLSLN